MIRIKVYKASHLLIGAVLVLLGIVLAVFLLRFALMGGNVAAGAVQQEGSSMVRMDDGAEAVAAFAAAPSLPPDAAGSTGKVREVVFGPIDTPAAEAPDENEHTDSQDMEFVIEVVPSETKPSVIEAPHDGTPMRILIYHTHTHEAYTQMKGDPYVETEKYRTKDASHSIVRVGEELAKLLTGYGFEVVHDTTDHEPPKLGTAYTRSLETLKRYKDEQFDLYIDLHRDAYGESIHKGVMTVSAKNVQTAQLMVLIGNGEGFQEKPDFQANYQFAQMLTDRLNMLLPNICRGVMVKNGRYNQQIGRAVLIEVGHHLNTLSEALASIPYLAEGIRDTLMGNEEAGIPALNARQ